MLTDLHRCVRPRLHIMDGIIAMEGNGPTSGTPIAMNVLLFSADPVALDTVYAALIHLDPATVPTCVRGAKGGIGVMDEGLIDVLTPDGVLTVSQAREKYGNAQFDVFRGTMKKGLLPKLMPAAAFFAAPPEGGFEEVHRLRGVSGGVPCAEKAVHSGHGKKAKYDYKKCIRCYCCRRCARRRRFRCIAAL